MLAPSLLLLASLILLIIGAEGLVRGSSSLALRLGLTPLVVGLTVVAFGTSSPELVVSIGAALQGQGDIAVGNVVGSNIFNIGVILGITALICPIAVRLQMIKIDVPIMIAAALLLPVLLWDGKLGFIEGLLLTIGIIAYTGFNVWLARKTTNPEVTEEFDSGVPGLSKHWGLDLLLILGGLGVLVLGSQLLVENAVILARALGLSEAVIGLTIIAAGTSMPELATSVVAALRKQPDIAVGNIVGSNVFNILGILGIATLVTPIEVQSIRGIDYAFMIGMSVVLLPFLWSGLRLRRLEGLVLLGIYGVYAALLWPKG